MPTTGSAALQHGALTPEEEYIIWSERVRMLFEQYASGPSHNGFCHQETQSVYDRPYDVCRPWNSTKLSGDCSPSTASEEDAGTDAGGAFPRGSADFYDEGSFPFCFLSQMLKGPRGGGVREDASNGRDLITQEEADAGQAEVSYTFSDVERFSSVSQPAFRSQQAARAASVDEDAEAARLTARLKAQAFRRRKEVQRQQALVHGTDPLTGRTFSMESDAFADPKVEAIQAVLHEEMTSLLLSLRAANRRSEEARQQLHFSRALRQHLSPPSKGTSSSSTESSLHEEDDVYESDFTD